MLVCGQHGQLSYPCGTAAVLPQTLPDTSVWPSGMPSNFRTPADALSRPMSPSGMRCYGNRSPGRRPLVGCNQRRWARASRVVRGPRSWPQA